MSSQLEQRLNRLEILQARDAEKLRRLQEAVDRLAQQNRALAAGSGSGGSGGSVRVGYASSTITARSILALGVGTVAVYSPASGTLTDTGVVLDVYSVDDKDIAAGTLCVVETIDGVDVASPLECSS